MEKIKVYLCVDAGGTKSLVGAFTVDGRLLAKTTGKSGSPAVTYEKWYQNIDEALNEIIQKNKDKWNLLAVGMGISGLSVINDIKEFEKYFEEKYQTKCWITSDVKSALYSLLNNQYDNGIIVIAGTGVAIYGKNQANEKMLGGWGHLLRERGSAYGAVHDFCVQMIDHYEEGQPLTNLEQAFLNSINLKDIRQLNHLFYQHSKDEIAKLSQFFKLEASKGSQEAINLLIKEGEKLAKQTIDTMKALNLTSPAIIGLTGGFIENDGKLIIDGFKKYMAKYNNELNYNQATLDQLKGVYNYITQNRK